jgi:hypothetical protein
MATAALLTLMRFRMIDLLELFLGGIMERRLVVGDDTAATPTPVR